MTTSSRVRALQTMAEGDADAAIDWDAFARARRATIADGRVTARNAHEARLRALLDRRATGGRTVRDLTAGIGRGTSDTKGV